MYTEEEVNQHIVAAQKRQMEADSMRIHGNAFFAEAIDHISGLARTDKFWESVLAYGKLFQQQFEVTTGQILPPKAAAPAAKGKEKKKEKEEPAAEQ